MLYDVTPTHYAVGDAGKPGEFDRIVRQHIAVFWPQGVPVPEGRAVPVGHLIDSDEPEEALASGGDDVVDWTEPESLGAFFAARAGEFLELLSESNENPEISQCHNCPHLQCYFPETDCLLELEETLAV